MLEFQKFNKIPRLFKPMVVTEKIDGTNAHVAFFHKRDLESLQDGVRMDQFALTILPHEEEPALDVIVLAGSRNRYLKIGEDNFAFASWVNRHAEELYNFLGHGRHYGEWFGQGIQRNYGLAEKRFALFNVGKWGYHDVSPTLDVPGLTVVPTLYRGEFNLGTVEVVHAEIMDVGSQAVVGFDKPEGVVVFHEAAGQCFKYTDDPRPKSVQEKIAELEHERLMDAAEDAALEEDYRTLDEILAETNTPID